MTSCQKFCKKCNVETERYKDGKCKICIRAKNNAWALRNRDSRNAKCREWNNLNAESKRATNARYRVKNKTLINDRRKIKRALDPSIEYNKLAKRRSAVGMLPKDIVNKLLLLQDGKCTCCGLELNNNYHLDHIIPISRGGANTEENVQLLLSKCNQEKYTLTMEEFLATRRANRLHIQIKDGINTILG